MPGFIVTAGGQNERLICAINAVEQVGPGF
jgi:hypothetical protein